jgi:hypothetical protein
MDVSQMRRYGNMERWREQEYVTLISDPVSCGLNQMPYLCVDVQFLMNLAPGATFEERNTWKLRDLAGRSVMLDRAVIVDRSEFAFSNFSMPQ